MQSDHPRAVLTALALRVTGALALLFFCAFAFTPLASVLDRLTAQPPNVQTADAIVVLGGGGVRGDGTLTDTSLRRTLHGIALYQRRLAPMIVLSGAPRASGPSESGLRAELARALGLPDRAIITEGSALTTRGEAQRIAQVLLPRGVRRVLLVTDAQGMRRAAGVFTQAGFEPFPAPTDDVSIVGGGPEVRLDLARRILMELCALAYYHAAGYL
jgi:uncharacterized SAM-binding protein YcdF (DUF218 family)